MKKQWFNVLVYADDDVEIWRGEGALYAQTSVPILRRLRLTRRSKVKPGRYRCELELHESPRGSFLASLNGKGFVNVHRYNRQGRASYVTRFCYSQWYRATGIKLGPDKTRVRLALKKATLTRRK